MKRRNFVAQLLASSILSVATGPVIGGEASEGHLLKVVECRNEAAMRFINDFVQVGAQQRIDGTEIVIRSFRNDHPERFDTYIVECEKRKSAAR